MLGATGGPDYDIQQHLTRNQLAAVYLYRSSARSLRYYVLAAFALNIVSPCLSVTQYHMRFFYPLPLAVPELIHQLRHPG